MNRKCNIEEQVLLTRRPKPMLVVITILEKRSYALERMLMVCALWVAGKSKIKLIDRWSQRG